jgi:hypothetical protein
MPIMILVKAETRCMTSIKSLQNMVVIDYPHSSLSTEVLLLIYMVL